ncbi:MAG: 2-iminoacetate synthase ThiH [Rikenellaceae bacterium]|nr:2-iminoacetate synthase ThiH [Rikenellaceae bacterium]
MGTFFDVLTEYNWDKVTEKIYSSSESDVLNAIAKDKLSLDDFAALVSPAAEKYIKSMAEKSYGITRRRFGNTMQLYVPLYLSNYCSNQCVYCGFNCKNRIQRTILNEIEIRREAEAIKQRYKFEHILLVTGEAPAKSSVEYMGRAIEIMKEYFSQVSLEVQPLDVDEYRYLIEKGLFAVYIYQETYNKDRYPLYHPKGRKADFRYRLETPDRLGKAGIYKTGLGNLIGLEEWRTEAFFTALHLRYLENKYWRTKYSIAFPRLRPFANEGDFDPNYPVTEKNLFQLICAYRLFSEDVELSVSTRESSVYRDKIMPFGVTTMSAGSKTMPGGYADDNGELEQFSVNDDRTPYEVESAVKGKGLEAVWKDWALYLQ